MGKYSGSRIILGSEGFKQGWKQEVKKMRSGRKPCRTSFLCMLIKALKKSLRPLVFHMHKKASPRRMSYYKEIIVKDTGYLLINSWCD